MKPAATREPAIPSSPAPRHNKIVTTLYVSDLDGTLLQDDAHISVRSRLLLDEMIRQGLLFTVASARSLISIRETLADLPLRLPVIEYNGAYVSDYTTGRHLVTFALATATARALLDCLRERGVSPFVSCHDGLQDRNFYETAANAAMAWYINDRREARDTRLHPIDDIERALEHPVVSLTMMGDHATLAPVETALHGIADGRIITHFYENQYDSGHWWLSVHPGQTDKGRAIGWLLKQQRLSGAEVVVFGDHDNDISMFRAADRAYAVANATEGLKACATAVIGPNSEDSVARHIASEFERSRLI